MQSGKNLNFVDSCRLSCPSLGHPAVLLGSRVWGETQLLQTDGAAGETAQAQPPPLAPRPLLEISWVCKMSQVLKKTTTKKSEVLWSPEDWAYCGKTVHWGKLLDWTCCQVCIMFFSLLFDHVWTTEDFFIIYCLVLCLFCFAFP